MKYLMLIPLTLLITSCGKQSKTKLYKVEESALTKSVNQKSLPQDPNLTLDKSIVNNSYPIEIALYEDNRFYYNLPNLGDGKGTWKLNNGVIELKAKRTLFDMYIEVQGSDEASQNLTIQFIDRFGPNTLKMMNVNI
ncbi:hypothetical protein ACJVC5_12775 [Peredibacter sp. HCB2-198]|uniref:hypothetical protein n=1 Tax=Peredibacter sp. HCB2-198 TaxID=3383025 RepID=UPI0038B643B1